MYIPNQNIVITVLNHWKAQFLGNLYLSHREYYVSFLAYTQNTFRMGMSWMDHATQRTALKNPVHLARGEIP